MIPLAASRVRLAAALAIASLALAACSPAATTAAPSSAAPSTVAGSAAPATSASPSASATSASPTPSATSAAPKPTPAGYTMADVKKHAGAASCWSVVDGTVYDLTKWVSRHPGGRARIVSMCGNDGSRLFHGEHGRESRPTRILAGYELGKLS